MKLNKKAWREMTVEERCIWIGLKANRGKRK